MKIISCHRCSRLRAYCKKVAQEKRRAFQDWQYWGKPVENFGDPQARLLIVGLAPAAHGANRTGRMFTGDRSGEWLYRALYKTGFANQAQSTSIHDGLKLNDCLVTAICHCAPPDNKPTKKEIENCHSWLQQTIKNTPAKVTIALGGIAWHELGRFYKLPKFKHGLLVPLPNGCFALASYHPSQQNTFTRRLTEPMFDAIFLQAKALITN